MSRAAYQREWRAKNRGRYKGRYVTREKSWCQKNRARCQASKDEWKRRNRHKVKAQQAVSNAIRDGRMVRLPCEVCGAWAEAHHDDYNKPLCVRWLCKVHHEEHHHESSVIIPPIPNDLHE